MRNLSKSKVVLGLSGGVDSTTAALLLKEKGLEVIGYYFDVLGDNEEGLEGARKVADQLGIKLITANVSDEFGNIVIKNFCEEYCCGRTPNPCVVCNPNIKFKKLIEVADAEGAYYIATGHYSRIHKDEANDLYYIEKGVNEKKDQSYMLYRLGQNVLSRLIFPLGEFEDKAKTRELAREHNLSNAEASDSQEICFVDDAVEDYQSYLARHGYKCKPGNFVDKDGKIVGKHKGLSNYTIGQRKGLGVALGKPAFVTKIDPKTNTITLGDNADLFTKEVYSIDNFFSATSSADFPFGEGEAKVLAKIRYAAKPSEATIEKLSDGRILTKFTEPQRAATPGQSIVFYDDDHVIGGGFID